YDAGANATNANYSVVIGDQARGNQSGSSGSDYNILIGYLSGYLVRNGDYNISIGANAGRGIFDNSYIIAIGASAWRDDQGSTYSIAIGNEAGRYHDYTTGSDNNIFIGGYAGRGDSTGSETDEDIFIGYSAGANAHRSSYNVFIGHQAGEFFRTTASMSTDGGGTGADGNVVVGANAGRGASLATPFSGSENVFVGYRAGEAATTAAWNVFIGAQTGTTATSGSGNILIGAGAELPAATTNDYFKIDNGRTADVLYGDMVSGNLTLKGTLTQLSDVRLKHSIHPLSDQGSAIEKIRKLKGVIYRWKPTKIKPDD